MGRRGDGSGGGGVVGGGRGMVSTRILKASLPL